MSSSAELGVDPRVLAVIARHPDRGLEARDLLGVVALRDDGEPGYDGASGHRSRPPEEEGARRASVPGRASHVDHSEESRVRRPSTEDAGPITSRHTAPSSRACGLEPTVTPSRSSVEPREHVAATRAARRESWIHGRDDRAAGVRRPRSSRAMAAAAHSGPATSRAVGGRPSWSWARRSSAKAYIVVVAVRPDPCAMLRARMLSSF